MIWVTGKHEEIDSVLRYCHRVISLILSPIDNVSVSYNPLLNVKEINVCLIQHSVYSHIENQSVVVDFKRIYVHRNISHLKSSLKSLD